VLLATSFAESGVEHDDGNLERPVSRRAQRDDSGSIAFASCVEA
jgi:hypothetical protein